MRRTFLDRNDGVDGCTVSAFVCLFCLTGCGRLVLADALGCEGQELAFRSLEFGASFLTLIVLVFDFSNVSVAFYQS